MAFGWLEITIITVLILGLTHLFGYLQQRPDHKYKPTLQEIYDLIKKASNGQLSRGEWEYFLNEKIRNDAFLEELRAKCSIFKNSQYKSPSYSKEFYGYLNEDGLKILRQLAIDLEPAIKKTSNQTNEGTP